MKGRPTPECFLHRSVFCSVDHGDDEDKNEEHGGASQSGIMIKICAKLNLRRGARANPENI